MLVLNFCGTNSNWQYLNWTTKSNGTDLLIETDVANSNGRMLIPTDSQIYSSFSSKSNHDLNEWLEWWFMETVLFTNMYLIKTVIDFHGSFFKVYD